MVAPNSSHWCYSSGREEALQALAVTREQAEERYHKQELSHRQAIADALAKQDGESEARMSKLAQSHVRSMLEATSCLF